MEMHEKYKKLQEKEKKLNQKQKDEDGKNKKLFKIVLEYKILINHYLNYLN